MPTPSPIKMPSVGPAEGMVTACDRSPVAIRPETSAAIATARGSSMASSDPNAMNSTIAAAIDPDAGADADRGPQRVLHRRAADVDLHAGGPRGLGEVDDAGDVRHGQARLRGVEDHGRVGDLPVPADLGGAAGRVRADHRGHRGRGGDLAQHGGDPVADGRSAYAA